MPSQPWITWLREVKVMLVACSSLRNLVPVLLEEFYLFWEFICCFEKKLRIKLRIYVFVQFLFLRYFSQLSSIYYHSNYQTVGMEQLVNLMFKNQRRRNACESFSFYLILFFFNKAWLNARMIVKTLLSIIWQNNIALLALVYVYIRG